jgi:hypothetical protein
VHVVSGGVVTLTPNASDAIESFPSGATAPIPVGAWAWVTTDAASSGNWRVQVSYELGSVPMALGPSNLFVDANLGNDSNTCFTSGSGACKTIQQAVNRALTSVSYAGTGPIINVADGTYAEQVACAYPVAGAPSLAIVGDLATPTNVVWVPPSTLVGLNVTNGCNVTLSGVFFNGPTACAYLDVFDGTISFQTVNFGMINQAAGCGEHILADHGGIVNILGPYTISGSMGFHMLVVGPSTVQHVEASFSMPNALTFTDFYSISGPANINYDQTVTCSGAGCGTGSTGARALMIGNANISTNSSVIPGSSAAILTGGGCIDTTCGTVREVLEPVPLATLGTCNAAAAGSMGTVTNSNTTTWGATIGSGGTQTVLAFCNGANWTVAGL